MKKLLSAGLAIVLLSFSVLPALANEEYVYPPTQAVVEKYQSMYLNSTDVYEGNISRVAAITGFYIYFDDWLERISLYEFSDIRLTRDGMPVEGVALEKGVKVTQDEHSNYTVTRFLISFTQVYDEPGIYHLECNFQEQKIETGYLLVEPPITDTPADMDALDSIDFCGTMPWLPDRGAYGVYNVCSSVDGLFFLFKGRQNAFLVRDLQELNYTRNGVPGVLAWNGAAQRSCWVPYYGEEPTEQDAITQFYVDFSERLVQPGVYTFSGRHQDREFRLDDILLLSFEQTESLLHAHKWAYEKLALAMAHGLVPDDTPVRFKDVITRAEFCRLAVRYLEAKTQMSIDDYLAQRENLRDIAFSDTDDGAVLAMARLGVVSGIGDSLFKPDVHITRQEAAQIVTNLQRQMGEEVANAPRAIYKDSAAIAQWAKIAVDYTADIKALEGDGVYFRPLDNITHEESVIVWENLYRYATR